MLNNVIDPVTGLPRKLGELYNDRNIRLVGEMRWDAAANRVDTKNLRLLSTPSDGGSPAITVIPDGSYSLSSANTSIWVELRRLAGSTTVVPGASLSENVSSQAKPRPNWIQLFVRTSTNDIVTLGNWVVLAAPQWTKAGVTRGTSIYDAIVGSASNPFATHTTIQGAIDDALDGDRILVLSGQYSLTGPGNSLTDASSALAWSGKTLTLEGEGYSTVLQNTGSLARAFSIVSTNASSNASFGSGCRIINMHLKSYPQTIRFNGGSGFGLRHCLVDLYSTDVSSYVAPAKIGTGTFACNVVKEQTVVGSTFAARQTVVGADVVTDVQTESAAVLSSTGSRIISVQNAMRIGDTNPPTQELDVVGDIRTTTGILHTAASSMNIVTDSGLSHNLKAKTLVLSDSLLDTASSQTLLVQGSANIATSLQIGGLSNIATVARSSNIVTITTDSPHSYFTGQTVTVTALTNISVNGTYSISAVPSPTSFTYANTGSIITTVSTTGTVRADMAPSQVVDVVGGVRTTTGRFHSPATFVGLYNDGSSALPVKVGSLVVSNNYGDSATSQSGLIRGNLQVDGSTTLGVSTAQSIQFKSPTSGYGVIPLGAVIATISGLTGAYNCTATTIPDSNGFVRCGGQTINDPGGPMNGVVVPNINDNYFIMGSTTNIGTLSAEQHTFNNPVYRVPAHSHNHSLFVNGTGAVDTWGNLGDHSHSISEHYHSLNHEHKYKRTNYYEGGDIPWSNSTGSADGGIALKEIAVQADHVDGGKGQNNLFYDDDTFSQSRAFTSGVSWATQNTNLHHAHRFDHGHSMGGGVGTSTNIDTTQINASLITSGSITNFRPKYISALYIMRVR